jgi:replicative DNA helicase
VSHVAALQEALREREIKVLFLDPLYLSLLAGQGPEGLSASNLYQIGPLLLAVAKSCLTIGCTPALVHHFKITRKDTYAEPQLEDLAYAGIQEFARQWILLGRRSPFDPDDDQGKHELWLSAGGSAGHSVLRAVDVFEGRLNEDFSGRTWRVTTFAPTDARAAVKDEKAGEKQRQKTREQKDDESKALAALDKLDPKRQGATLTQLRLKCQDMGVSRNRADRALSRLAEETILEEAKLTSRGQTARGYRRPGGRTTEAADRGAETSAGGLVTAEQEPATPPQE